MARIITDIYESQPVILFLLLNLPNAAIAIGTQLQVIFSTNIQHFPFVLQAQTLTFQQKSQKTWHILLHRFQIRIK